MSDTDDRDDDRDVPVASTEGEVLGDPREPQHPPSSQADVWADEDKE